MTQSEVNAMEREAAQIEAENARLKSEINAMVSSINSANAAVYSGGTTALETLKTGEATIKKDDNILVNVGKTEEEIRKKMILYKNVENAYKTIRRLNNDLRYHQGGEKTVRRMITAIIDNESKNLASDETIAEQAEKLYLNTQYFFLSHVMMDLQLRKRGETAAADRARDKALEMDKRKCTWVYFIIALIRGEEKETQYWLDRLVEEPLVGSEEEQLKALVLISLKRNDSTSEQLKKYTGLDQMQEVDDEKLVAKITADFMRCMTIEPPEFAYINECVAEKDSLKAALRGAMNNEEVGAFVQKLTGAGKENERLDLLTRVLDVVVESCRSPKSEEIHAEIAYQEKIIEAKGVIEEAMALRAKEKVSDVSAINLEECLFAWLNDNDAYSGKKDIVDFSYDKFKPSYKHAYKNYVRAYRSKYTDSVTLKIGEYQNKTTLTDLSAEEANVATFCKQRCEAIKAQIKDTKFILCMVFGGLLLIAGIVFNFLESAIGSPWNIVGLVIGIVAGLALLILGVRIKYGNYKKKIAADEQMARDTIDYTEKLRCVYGDIVNYRESYRSFDDKELQDDFF